MGMAVLNRENFSGKLKKLKAIFKNKESVDLRFFIKKGKIYTKSEVCIASIDFDIDCTNLPDTAKELYDNGFCINAKEFSSFVEKATVTEINLGFEDDHLLVLAGKTKLEIPFEMVFVPNELISCHNLENIKMVHVPEEYTHALKVITMGSETVPGNTIYQNGATIFTYSHHALNVYKLEFDNPEPWSLSLSVVPVLLNIEETFKNIGFSDHDGDKWAHFECDETTLSFHLPEFEQHKYDILVKTVNKLLGITEKNKENRSFLPAEFQKSIHPLFSVSNKLNLVEIELKNGKLKFTNKANSGAKTEFVCDDIVQDLDIFFHGHFDMVKTLKHGMFLNTFTENNTPVICLGVDQDPHFTFISGERAK